MTIRFSTIIAVALLACGAACLATGRAAASELVYTPINPHFGGNPFNAAGLLASAEAQKRFKDNSGPTFPDVVINPEPPEPPEQPATPANAATNLGSSLRLD